MNKEQIINEYPQDYCRALEIAYGQSMMSEGGSYAIDEMFTGIQLHNKICLDIGAGLGGVPTYLAEKYHCKVTGIELNPWMREEATNRIPPQLQSLLNYVLYDDNNQIPSEDKYFDVVYSKGVLVHLQDKTNLFKEVKRVTKDSGILVIDDWLSPGHSWGPIMKKMCEVDNLSLYPQTQIDYQKCLESAGFKDIIFHEMSPQYCDYNIAIINRLEEPQTKEMFLSELSFDLYNAVKEGYILTAEAMQTGELLVFNITAKAS